MNLILKIFFQQTEKLLHLTKTSINAYKLQINLVNDHMNIFDRNYNQQCAFSYDLSHEHHSIEKSLHATCFVLKRALYRM